MGPLKQKKNRRRQDVRIQHLTDMLRKGCSFFSFKSFHCPINKTKKFIYIYFPVNWVQVEKKKE